MMRAYFLAASRESSSLLAPVHTILPDENIRAVVLGSLILIMTAANRFGLYSAFLNENYEIFIYFVIIATLCGITWHVKQSSLDLACSLS